MTKTFFQRYVFGSSAAIFVKQDRKTLRQKKLLNLGQGHLEQPSVTQKGNQRLEFYINRERSIFCSVVILGTVKVCSLI
jgi:pyruvate kinase